MSVINLNQLRSPRTPRTPHLPERSKSARIEVPQGPATPTDSYTIRLARWAWKKYRKYVYPAVKLSVFYIVGCIFCEYDDSRCFAHCFMIYTLVVDYHYEGWSVLDSVYFITATLTTVGYGDIHPTNQSSQLFTAFYILIGLSFVFTVITNFANGVTPLTPTS